MEGSKRKVIAAAVALAVTLSACGGSGKPAASSTPAAAAPTDTPAAAAATPCKALEDPYGSPPGNFKYKKADAATKQKTITALGLKPDGVDMREAEQGGVTLGSLVSIPSDDPDGYVSTVVGRAQSGGAKVVKGSGFSVITVPNGANIAIGAKGCRAIMITSQDPNGVRYLAASVFDG